jgi:hypothetical protein
VGWATPPHVAVGEVLAWAPVGAEASMHMNEKRTSLEGVIRDEVLDLSAGHSVHSKALLSFFYTTGRAVWSIYTLAIGVTPEYPALSNCSLFWNLLTQPCKFRSCVVAPSVNRESGKQRQAKVAATSSILTEMTSS